MDTRHPNSNLSPMILAEATSVFRYQLYRQEHSGLFSAQFETNNAAKAVEAFLSQNPAFEHGCMRLWNHREQRICASIAHQPMTPFQPVDRLHQWGLQLREAA